VAIRTRITASIRRMPKPLQGQEQQHVERRDDDGGQQREPRKEQVERDRAAQDLGKVAGGDRDLAAQVVRPARPGGKEVAAALGQVLPRAMPRRAATTWRKIAIRLESPTTQSSVYLNWAPACRSVAQFPGPCSRRSRGAPAPRRRDTGARAAPAGRHDHAAVEALEREAPVAGGGHLGRRRRLIARIYDCDYRNTVFESSKTKYICFQNTSSLPSPHADEHGRELPEGHPRPLRRRRTLSFRPGRSRRRWGSRLGRSRPW
jgi:hypothetical protein